MPGIIIIISALFACVCCHAQKVGIGTTTPEAALDVSSTDNGFLPPRLTIAQRDSIRNPVAGLVIFCIDCDELEVHNGTTWKNMSNSAACVTPTLPSIKICDQIWMAENLNVSTYRNGDSIPLVTAAGPWSTLNTGAYCYYDNDPTLTPAKFGKLYNWYAVMDPRGLAPAGWHIPSDLEWEVLEGCLTNTLGLSTTIRGGALKQTGISYWNEPNRDATNKSGFTGLPAGYRSLDGIYFENIWKVGYWWTTKEHLDIPSAAWIRYVAYNSGELIKGWPPKRSGISVRCIKD